jgi:hypothetical protein
VAGGPAGWLLACGRPGRVGWPAAAIGQAQAGRHSQQARDSQPGGNPAVENFRQGLAQRHPPGLEVALLALLFAAAVALGQLLSVVDAAYLGTDAR